MLLAFIADGGSGFRRGCLLLECRCRLVAPPRQVGWGPGPRAWTWDSVITAVSMGSSTAPRIRVGTNGRIELRG